MLRSYRLICQFSFHELIDMKWQTTAGKGVRGKGKLFTLTVSGLAIIIFSAHHFYAYSGRLPIIESKWKCYPTRTQLLNTQPTRTWCPVSDDKFRRWSKAVPQRTDYSNFRQDPHRWSRVYEEKRLFLQSWGLQRINRWSSILVFIFCDWKERIFFNPCLFQQPTVLGPCGRFWKKTSGSITQSGLFFKSRMLNASGIDKPTPERVSKKHAKFQTDHHPLPELFKPNYQQTSWTDWRKLFPTWTNTGERGQIRGRDPKTRKITHESFGVI